MSQLIDGRDIINNTLNDIAPKYFDTDLIDKNRVSAFGFLVETMAKATEDTLKMNVTRAQNYVPELSNNEIIIKSTAKLLDMEILYPEPATTYAVLSLFKQDILERGTVDINGNATFTIDKRSNIINNNIYYSLVGDISIHAVKVKDGYVYAARYTDSDTSYIQTYEDVSEEGFPIISILVSIVQVKYNIQELLTIDALEFLYTGLDFTYENLLAGFDVSYRLDTSDTYVALDTKYYLSDETPGQFLYHNDDEAGVIYILNNPVMNLPSNVYIKVEMKETLGTDGAITPGISDSTFELYKDNRYNYSGVYVHVTIIEDSTTGTNGDNLASIKANMIRAKTYRNNITTDLDILNYINDTNANVFIVKKAIDYYNNMFNLYTLIRNGDEIVPATTKDLVLGPDDMDVNFGSSQIMKSNAKFQVNEAGLVERVPDDTPDEECLNLPFLTIFNEDGIPSYLFNNVNEEYYLSPWINNDLSPYQALCRGITIYRNQFEDYDTYKLTGTIFLNTSTNLEIIDNEGNIINPDNIRTYIIFKSDTDNVAYLPLNITAYDRETNGYIIEGSFKTNDFISDDGKLQITDGLYYVGTETLYDSTINFSMGTFDIYFLHKSPPTMLTDTIYSLVPNITDYTYMNTYNNRDDRYDLLLELNKFCRSSILYGSNNPDSYEIIKGYYESRYNNSQVITIPGFNSETDVLILMNDRYILQNGIDYLIDRDDTIILKAFRLNVGDILDYEIFRVFTKSTKVFIYSEHYEAGEEVPDRIPIENYNYETDYLQVLFHQTLLREGIDYIKNDDNSISFIGLTLKEYEIVDFRIITTNEYFDIITEDIDLTGVNTSEINIPGYESITDTILSVNLNQTSIEYPYDFTNMTNLIEINDTSGILSTGESLIISQYNSTTDYLEVYIDGYIMEYLKDYIVENNTVTITRPNVLDSMILVKLYKNSISGNPFYKFIFQDITVSYNNQFEFITGNFNRVFTLYHGNKILRNNIDYFAYDGKLIIFNYNLTAGDLLRVVFYEVLDSSFDIIASTYTNVFMGASTLEVPYYTNTYDYLIVNYNNRILTQGVDYNITNDFVLSFTDINMDENDMIQFTIVQNYQSYNVVLDTLRLVNYNFTEGDTLAVTYMKPKSEYTMNTIIKSHTNTNFLEDQVNIYIEDYNCNTDYLFVIFGQTVLTENAEYAICYDNSINLMGTALKYNEKLNFVILKNYRGEFDVIVGRSYMDDQTIVIPEYNVFKDYLELSYRGNVLVQGQDYLVQLDSIIKLLNIRLLNRKEVSYRLFKDMLESYETIDKEFEVFKGLFISKWDHNRIVHIPEFNSATDILTIIRNGSIRRNGSDYIINADNTLTLLSFELNASEGVEYEILRTYDVSDNIDIESGSYTFNKATTNPFIVAGNYDHGRDYVQLIFSQTLLREGIDYNIDESNNLIQLINLTVEPGESIDYRVFKVVTSEGNVVDIKTEVVTITEDNTTLIPLTTYDHTKDIIFSVNYDQTQLIPGIDYRNVSSSIDIISQTYSGTSKTVGLIDFKEGRDYVEVFKNRKYLTRDIDYTLSEGNITFINELTSMDIFNFNIFTGGASGNIANLYTVNYEVEADGLNRIYYPTTDKLFNIFKDGEVLRPDVDYHYSNDTIVLYNMNLRRLDKLVFEFIEAIDPRFNFINTRYTHIYGEDNIIQVNGFNAENDLLIADLNRTHLIQDVDYIIGEGNEITINTTLNRNDMLFFSIIKNHKTLFTNESNTLSLRGLSLNIGDVIYVHMMTPLKEDFIMVQESYTNNTDDDFVDKFQVPNFDRSRDYLLVNFGQTVFTDKNYTTSGTNEIDLNGVFLKSGETIYFHIIKNYRKTIPAIIGYANETTDLLFIDDYNKDTDYVELIYDNRLLRNKYDYEINSDSSISLLSFELGINDYVVYKLYKNYNGGELGNYYMKMTEVPFIKYDYFRDNTKAIYDEILKMRDIYTEMLTLTTSFNINLKFTSTYGDSKYIYIEDEQLNNLNPIVRYKIYGRDIPVSEIKTFIIDFFRRTYINNNTIFTSNIDTLLENTYSQIRGVKYLGTDNFDSRYQKIYYEEPNLETRDRLLSYVPESLNITEIDITIEEI